MRASSSPRSRKRRNVALLCSAGVVAVALVGVGFWKEIAARYQAVEEALELIDGEEPL